MMSVLHGDVQSAKIEVQEGIRLIEGILIGRHFKDVPVIAQRICGICPVVHNLTAIKAVENAFGIIETQETEALRKLLEWAQFIHSHALHLFFLSLADFLDIENDLQLVSEYPKQAKQAIQLREFGMLIVRTVGGRVVHPLTNEAGGFKKVPTVEELQEMIQMGEKALPVALELGAFFRGVRVPDFTRATEYVCLEKNGEYAIYDGDLVSNKGLRIPVSKFEANFHELHRPKEMIKRVESDLKTSYNIGAIARVNIQRDKLNTEAEKYLGTFGFQFPDYNPFHNIYYQMVEVIQAIEDSLKILKNLGHLDLQNALSQPFEVKEGIGVAAVEAPRGTLFYHLDIDARGYVKNANIITPTAQSLSNMEDDVKAYLPRVLELPPHEREKKLRALIRAYDPCISCAVH